MSQRVSSLFAGVFALPAWLAAGGTFAIGSDSHISLSPAEELRWLEYGQRLARQQRNVAAAPEAGMAASAERLFSRTLAGCAAAAGVPTWGLVPGARADALVVDRHEDALLGLPASHTLDALLFSSPGRSWRNVLVAGRWVIRDGTHARAAVIGERFTATMHALA